MSLTVPYHIYIDRQAPKRLPLIVGKNAIYANSRDASKLWYKNAILIANCKLNYVMSVFGFMSSVNFCDTCLLDLIYTSFPMYRWTSLASRYECIF